MHHETLIKDTVSASGTDDHLETLSERPAGHESDIMNERGGRGAIDLKNNNLLGHKIKLED